MILVLVMTEIWEIWTFNLFLSFLYRCSFILKIWNKIKALQAASIISRSSLQNIGTMCKIGSVEAWLCSPNSTHVAEVHLESNGRCSQKMYKVKMAPCYYIVIGLYFLPRLFFIFFIYIWVICSGFGVGVLLFGSWIGLLGLRFSVDGVWGLWCGAFWILGVGTLYINIDEKPWEKPLPLSNENYDVLKNYPTINTFHCPAFQGLVLNTCEVPLVSS